MSPIRSIFGPFFGFFERHLPSELRARLRGRVLGLLRRKTPPVSDTKSGYIGRKSAQPRFKHFHYGVKGDGKPRILITGGLGQLGYGLAKKLREQFGVENVIVSDVRRPPVSVIQSGPFVYLDILDKQRLESVCVDMCPDWLVHLAYMPMAISEAHLPLTLRINVEGVHNIMDVATRYHMRLFIPSSIASCSPDFLIYVTSEEVCKHPKPINDVTKVHAENLGQYYSLKHGLDFRCLRFSGVIFPYQHGHSIANYVPAMLQDALAKKPHDCFLQPNTRLPMIYIDDLLSATMDYLMVPECKLTTRTYNISALEFTPEELANTVKRFYSNFEVKYRASPMQAIADSWIYHMDYSSAVKDWAYYPMFTNLPELCEEMFRIMELEQK